MSCVLNLPCRARTCHNNHNNNNSSNTNSNNNNSNDNSNSNRNSKEHSNTSNDDSTRPVRAPSAGVSGSPPCSGDNVTTTNHIYTTTTTTTTTTTITNTITITIIMILTSRYPPALLRAKAESRVDRQRPSGTYNIEQTQYS